MCESNGVNIQTISQGDRAWINEFYVQRWGSDRVVTRGRLYTVAELPGFITWEEDSRVGLLTYHAAGDELEIVTLDSLVQGQGVGSKLISAAIQFAHEKEFRRVWLITTNDNTPALRFYQKNVFTLVKVHKDAIQVSRQLKPEIPMIGLDGIPILDEIELEYLLS
jgi:ribosomal protein S18 acetylase RimI-like enzyme